jgi:hypothetical protein
VSFEISFDSKQPKLEPKLVSALYETKRLFRLFRFYTEIESFDVSIEPKQTEDQLNQFDREHGLLFFTENLGFFQSFLFFFDFSVLFGLVLGSIWLPRGFKGDWNYSVYMGEDFRHKTIKGCSLLYS